MRVKSENIQDLRKLYPFEKFQSKILELDSCLKAGGLLVVHNSQYRVADTSAGMRFEPLATARHIRTSGPLFDRNSRRLQGAPESYSVFIKKAAGGDPV